jgi:hypothetical protein
MHLCKGDVTLHRGSVLENGSVLNGYEKGSIIITSTFLSSSKNLLLAEVFSNPDSRKTGQISLLCKYEIHNYRHTELEMDKISQYPDEEEILIYPYVPFRILSFEIIIIDSTGNERIEVCFGEVAEWKDNNSESIYINKC